MIVNERNYPPDVIDRTLRGIGTSPVISYRYDLLSSKGVKIGVIKDIESGSVSYNESRATKRTGTFTIVESGHDAKNINFLSDQLQPWFVLHMVEGGTVEWPLGIFLMEAPDRSVDRKVGRRVINAFDRALILEQWKTRNRVYFPAGTKYTDAIMQILSMARMNNADIDPSDRVMEVDKEYPIGTSGQVSINEMLAAINYGSLSVDAAGAAWAEAYSPPSQRSPKIHYMADKHSVIGPRFEESMAIARIPNVFIGVADNADGGMPLKSVFVNDNASSPVSTINRGREIVDVRSVKDIYDQESLDARVYRVALESTAAYRTLKFSTLQNPYHGEGDTLYIHIPGLVDVPAKFAETAWEMELKAGAMMTHAARMVVDL
ncbi:MAG: hypothetical protein LBS19_16830 [Clostridiales bacterium]|nr:hypothetical protein [Clostridiales bacterium]